MHVSVLHHGPQALPKCEFLASTILLATITYDIIYVGVRSELLVGSCARRQPSYYSAACLQILICLFCLHGSAQLLDLFRVIQVLFLSPAQTCHGGLSFEKLVGGPAELSIID